MPASLGRRHEEPDVRQRGGAEPPEPPQLAIAHRPQLPERQDAAGSEGVDRGPPQRQLSDRGPVRLAGGAAAVRPRPPSSSSSSWNGPSSPAGARAAPFAGGSAGGRSRLRPPHPVERRPAAPD